VRAELSERSQRQLTLDGRIANLQPDVRGVCTPPELFAQQMELLAERYEPIGLPELTEQLAAGELAPGAVAVTFDGGYLDALATAYPIVADLGIPSTVFVDPTVSDGRREGWWDEVERIMTSEDPLPERLTLSTEGLELELPTRTAQDRLAALLQLDACLSPLDARTISRVLRDVRAWSGLDPPVRESHRFLVADEIATLGASATGRVGLALTPHQLSRHGGGVGMIATLRAQLEQIVKAPVEAAAYPAGSWDLATIELARRAGVRIGCTCEGDPVTADSDPLRLPRLPIRDDSVEMLQLRLDRLVVTAR
jgi:peptidoglycan/xylan/chitin deacetylase (PgdA/CDA1 family)